jgi:hypothetical protein
MKTATFLKLVKSLLNKILKEDFAIASSEVIYAKVFDDEFEFVDIKFFNGQRITGVIDEFNQELTDRVFRSLFACFLEAQKKVEIIDEPEWCHCFITFRDCISESLRLILNSYFESVIVPALNKRIFDKLISLFGEDI